MLAATRTRYGHLSIYILLRREGWFVDHERVNQLRRPAAVFAVVER